MKLSFLSTVTLLALPALVAQQSPPAPNELIKGLEAIGGYAGRLQPMLEQARPREWVAKGAPDTYIAQWTSSLEQCKGLALAAKNVSQRLDRLPDVLQLLFRIQSLEITTGSLEDGLRRYQNPALADLLSAARAESSPVREKLQQYALELAAEKDQQFQVADREAQRCRQDLSREAPRSRTAK